MDIISACLVGIPCRYDGKCCKDDIALKLFLERKVLPVCPEVLGGLNTPRVPSEVVSGTGDDVLTGHSAVLDATGEDLTKSFILGAKRTLEVCRALGAKKAYLKSKSPSCGCEWIHDGSFSGALKQGNGVTAALLQREGIEVIEIG